MNSDILVVLLLIVLAVILFVWEKISPELTAMIILITLVISGVLSLDQGLSGFSNQATITVGAMFILSAALKETGLVSAIGLISSRIFRTNFWLGLLVIMLLVGVLSAFINNTPIVAIFIPIMLNVSQKTGNSPSRLLMPISFASIFGGACTLIGTSTNILVNSVAIDRGLPPIGMFEFSAMGLVLLAAGTAYMLIFGVRLIPIRSSGGGLVDKYHMNQYLTDIQLLDNSPSLGKKIPESLLVSNLEIDVLEVIRSKQRLLRPIAEITLEVGDTLRVRCDIEKIRLLQETDGIRIISHTSLSDSDFKDEQLSLIEAIIAPNSMLIGKTIKTSRFRNRFNANALAIRHRGQLFNLGFRDMPLDAGDAILIEVRLENYEELKNDYNFVILSEITVEKGVRRRSLPVLAVIGTVVGTAAIGLMPITVSAIAGCLVLILFRMISIEDALAAVEWRILLLLAGMIPLGTALQKSGAAALISNSMVNMLTDFGPLAVLAALYLLTSILTSVMSNNATAVLLTPIAIAAAMNMGLSPKPFIMVVAFAASSSFMTPIGYQTNLMVYGVGQYRFIDFFKIGTPLTLLFWIVTTLVIPILFPF